MSRDKQNIKTTDWLTRGMTEAEIAKKKEEAIREAEAELRDKQIEEMAWLKCHCHSNKGICGMDGKPCDLDCGSYHEAEALYNAGYRKASEVAEKVIRKMEQIVEVEIIGIEEDFFHGTAAHWDATRKKCYEEMLVELAELKKKYTEGNK